MKLHDLALASFDHAIALQPDGALAHQKRGVVLVSKGDMVGAEQMFRKALELAPDFAEPWFSLVNIRQFQSPDHADVHGIQSLIRQPGLSSENRELLLFSLGKVYDDCGRHDEAFEYYRQANEIRNQTVAYHAADVSRRNHRLREVFSRDFLARPFASGSDSRTPVFIVGMPRSGTTLLASMLSNHRSVATAGELPTLDDFAARLPGLTGGHRPYPQAVRELTPAVAVRLIQEYEQRLRRDAGPGVPHIIDKHPLNFLHLGLITLLFPKARILHCTRHPLDIGLSTYFQRFPRYYDYSFDLKNIGHFYREYTRLMEHWRQVLPRKPLEISYEDLILNTEPVVRRLLEDLELEWDEHCLAPHTNPCAVETASNWQVRQPIYRQALGRWRHYKAQLAPLVAALAPAGPEDFNRG
jgi:tetratricopeptide (TPR) repeat protein